MNNDLNGHYVISPGDMEMNKSNKNPCSSVVHLGSMVKCMYLTLSSHDKIKGVIVTSARNNVLFTNDVTCQVYISDFFKKKISDLIEDTIFLELTLSAP